MRRWVLLGAAIVVCSLAIGGWLIARDDGLDPEQVERQIETVVKECPGPPRASCRPAGEGRLRCSMPGAGENVLVDDEHPEISVIC